MRTSQFLPLLTAFSVVDLVSSFVAPMANYEGSIRLQALRFTPERSHRTFLFASKSASEQTSVLPWTRQRLEEYALERGVVLSFTTLGPAYRALARSKHNTTQIMGYVEGFVRPGNKILHLDKMQVFRKIIKAARIENPNEFKGGGTILGVGLLLGYLCLLHGRDEGCVTAEFLAIDDEDFQHKRLVRYYTSSGFDVIKYVGEDFRDIPDRMVWGGCGTLLRKEIPFLLEKWTRLMERS